MAKNTDPADYLLEGVKNYLAALDDTEFDDLVAETREPDTAATTGADALTKAGL